MQAHLDLRKGPHDRPFEALDSRKVNGNLTSERSRGVRLT